MASPEPAKRYTGDWTLLGHFVFFLFKTLHTMGEQSQNPHPNVRGCRGGRAHTRKNQRDEGGGGGGGEGGLEVIGVRGGFFGSYHRLLHCHVTPPPPRLSSQLSLFCFS